MPGAVPVSTQDKLRFPRRLASYEWYRRLSARSPDHQRTGKRARSTAELVDGHVVAGDAGAFSDIFDLPDPSGPRFVTNATSVQTGALFRFSKPYIADYRIGRVLNPSPKWDSPRPFVPPVPGSRRPHRGGRPV